MKCYNCRIELTDITNHEEHIPAKNIFATYPDEYKVQLLKVPSCYECNNKYSKIDQEIRDAIGIMNEKDELQHTLTQKSVRSIFRRNNWKDRIVTTDNGRSFEVSFCYDDFRKLHIKNFKGLFYNKYKLPVPEEYEIEVIAEGDEENIHLQRVSKYLLDYLNERSKWNIIGHRDIFKYKLKAMIPDQFGKIQDSSDISNSIGFVCIMEYHKAIKPLVIATRKDFIEKSKELLSESH